MVTLKLEYNAENHERIVEMIRNYNSVFGICYNYMFEHPKASTKEIISYINTKNNIFLDTYFKNGAIYDSKTEITQSKDKRIVFGGRYLYKQRCQHKLTSEEYKLKKLRPLNVVGAAFNNGNVKFQIIDENTILFKPNRYEHFELKLTSQGRSYKKRLRKLKALQDNKLLPITYKLGLNHVYVTYDYELFEQLQPYNKVKDRMFAIDLNPNYIGYTVIDWLNSDDYKIVDSGVYSLKTLNDYDFGLKRKRLSTDSEERKYVKRKRHHEVIDIAYKLLKVAKHYRCEVFVVEDLTIKSNDKKKGKRFNRLCNNLWCRNLLVGIVKKQCDALKIKLLEVFPEYSSFIGNMVYRDEHLPDMCLASIEISRRGYEFYHQYVLKDKDIEKNIVYNNSVGAIHKVAKTLEEFGYCDAWAGYVDLYKQLKKRNCKYRFPLETSLEVVKGSFRKEHTKSYQTYYKFG